MSETLPEGISRNGTRPQLTELGSLLGDVEGAELHIEPGQRLFICGDVHLGDGSFADPFAGKDAHFIAFLDHVAEHGAALVILGDALDFHQAWYFSRILRAHHGVLQRLRALCQEIPVYYIYGNHDPDLVMFRGLLPWRICNQVVVNGDRVLIQHGYEYDSYIGERFDESSNATKVLNLYERALRTWIRVPLKDYYTLSNRFVHWLFHYCIFLSQALGWVERRLGLSGRTRERERTIEFWTKTELGDPMAITRPILARVLSDRFETIVCGHSHLPGVVPLGSRAYANTGSWIFHNSQYGMWTPERGVEIRDWLSGRSYDEEEYLPILRGETDRSYTDWFADEYMGWLRFKSGEEGRRRGVLPPGHELPAAPQEVPDYAARHRPLSGLWARVRERRRKTR